jgi:hypothetical protein
MSLNYHKLYRQQFRGNGINLQQEAQEKFRLNKKEMEKRKEI